MNRDSCAVVLVPENAPVQVGNLMQSFKATAYRGKTVRLTAWLRLETMGPEDRAQMWLGVDRADDKKGFFDDMRIARSARPSGLLARSAHGSIQTQRPSSSGSCRSEKDASGSITCPLKLCRITASATRKSPSKP
jgi:hypothetical protein